MECKQFTEEATRKFIRDELVGVSPDAMLIASHLADAFEAAGYVLVDTNNKTG